MKSSLQNSPHGTLYAGTSGWAYPTWKPLFYPQDLPARKLLAHYGTCLNSVEVNSTFRRLPTSANVTAWLASVPKSFRFSLKVPQRITHTHRLRDCGASFDDFVASIAHLSAARQLGALLCQLPPNFKADHGRLDAFLACVHENEAARTLRIAFEFRNSSWFHTETYRVLIRHRAALCIAESDELTTPEVFTAPFACYRLRRSKYSSKDIEKLARRIETPLATGDVYAYFMHEHEPSGALRAVELLKHFPPPPLP